MVVKESAEEGATLTSIYSVLPDERAGGATTARAARRHREARPGTKSPKRKLWIACASQAVPPTPTKRSSCSVTRLFSTTRQRTKSAKDRANHHRERGRRKKRERKKIKRQRERAEASPERQLSPLSDRPTARISRTWCTTPCSRHSACKGGRCVACNSGTQR